MSSLSARMLNRLYGGSVGSRLLEPDAQVSPSQSWFSPCGRASSQWIFMMRWQSCWPRTARIHPPVTRVGAELTATMELWEAGTGRLLAIESYGDAPSAVIWLPFCKFMLFKYSEAEL